MKKKDLIASVIFLIIAVVLYTYASSFSVKEGVTIALNPGFYPRFISGILAVLSVLMMVESLKKKEIQDDCPVTDSIPLYKSKGGLNLILTILMLISYPFLLKGLGFASAAFAFILIMIIVLTENVRSKLFFIVSLSLLMTFLMYFIFKIVLRIPFPSGILI